MRIFVFVIGFSIVSLSSEGPMADQRKTLWYVEIKDGTTNEAAMVYLSETCDATPDKFERIKDCAGVPHNVLSVTRSFINTLDRNKKGFGFFYTVYRRHERDTCVRIWEFPKKGRIARTKKYKEAGQWVKNKALK